MRGTVHLATAELLGETVGVKMCTIPACLENPVEAGATLKASSWGRVKSLDR